MKKFLMLLTIIAGLSLTACKTTVEEQETTTSTSEQTEPSNTLFGNKSTEEWKEYYSDLIDIDEDGNGTPDWQEQQITINYAFRFYGEDDDTNIMFRNALKWAEQYPNITVVRDPRFKVSLIPYEDDFLQLETLVAASQDNTMPDIFYSPLSAELYDQDLVLDLTPYLRTDDEARFLTDNAINFIRTYDGEEIFGVPYQSVSMLPVVNKGVLEQNSISIPSYDWTYEEYEAVRSSVAEVTESGSCVFPGTIDFSQIGPHYFDSIPNGWKGFNIETQRFEFENAVNYGDWFQQIVDEGFEGLSWHDLSEEERATLCSSLTDPWFDGADAMGNIWFYVLNQNVNTLVNERNVDIDIYPMPTAPEGGTTALQAYYDTLSLSYKLEEDPVKAQAVFELLKWLSYSENGTESRWDILYDDIDTYGYNVDDYVNNKGGNAADFPLLHPSTNLMDYIAGWPTTNNPEVLKNHPLVKGFEEDSPFAIYNFEAFKNTEFQEQLSNPVAYPRQIPGAAKVFAELDPWQIKVQMQTEGYTFNEISADWDEINNTLLDDFLRSYNK